ncbi:gp43 domain protein, partial [Escherichia coli 2-156-04_S3_C3]
LAEVRAQGVDTAIEHLHKKFKGTVLVGVPVMALEYLAAELRKGGNQ